MSLTFQVEPFSEVIEEAIPLLIDHYNETVINKEVTPFDPAWEMYWTLEQAGVLHIVTAKDEGKLVGYVAYIIVVRNLHYDLSYAESDIFYLAPEHRDDLTRERLLNFAEESLRATGVQRVLTKTKLAPEHDLGPLLERIGFSPIERVYMKVL